MTASAVLPHSGTALNSLEVLEMFLEERRARVRAETAAHGLRDELDRDPLTGALNERAYRRELVTRLAALVEGSATAFAVAAFDLNGFKELQDRIGSHLAGDEALRHFRKAVEAQLSSADLFFRIHGDEHAVILDAEREVDLRALLQRVNGPFHASWQGLPVTFTASIGATVVRRPCPLHELLSELEDLLYEAKGFRGVLIGPLPWAQLRLPLGPSPEPGDA